MRGLNFEEKACGYSPILADEQHIQMMCTTIYNPAEWTDCQKSAIVASIGVDLLARCHPPIANICGRCGSVSEETQQSCMMQDSLVAGYGDDDSEHVHFCSSSTSSSSGSSRQYSGSYSRTCRHCCCCAVMIHTAKTPRRLTNNAGRNAKCETCVCVSRKSVVVG